jgi:OmpA-OmpF porin, OOP family
MKYLARALAVIAVTLAVAAAAFAGDIADSKDHPLVGRYKDASIVFYKASNFDEGALLKAPHDYGALLDKNATKDRSGPEWLKVEGKTTWIRYEIPKGRSSLEVIRNYETSLKAQGFSSIFSCADAACLTGKLTDNYLTGEQLDPANGISTAYADHARYLLAKLDRPEGAVYASIVAGEDKDNVVAFVTVVETRPMQGDQIAVIKAEAMTSAIDSGQSVNIYGIQFDFDQDTLRPDSKPTLDEIGKLLAGRPDLRLNIVGHTDGKGAAAYNLDLSKRRAANVVAALVRDYGIDAGRLASEGAGMTKPLASNDTDEGRAKNRRVELVKQ